MRGRFHLEELAGRKNHLTRVAASLYFESPFVVHYMYHWDVDNYKITHVIAALFRKDP